MMKERLAVCVGAFTLAQNSGIGDRLAGRVHLCVVSTTAKKCTCASPKNVRAKQKLSEFGGESESRRVARCGVRSLRARVADKGRLCIVNIDRDDRYSRQALRNGGPGVTGLSSAFPPHVRRSANRCTGNCSLHCQHFRHPWRSRGGSRQLSATRARRDRTGSAVSGAALGDSSSRRRDSSTTNFGFFGFPGRAPQAPLILNRMSEDIEPETTPGSTQNKSSGLRHVAEQFSL
jgi:hypothetical protein